MSFVYRPRYVATLWRVDPTSQRLFAAYDLTSLIRFDGLNVVAGGVANATATFADFDNRIRTQAQPQVMDLFTLSSNSRFDARQKGIWTGVLDEVHTQFDPDHGSTVQLVLTGGYKYFTIATQTPEQVQRLQLAYIQGVSASAILRYAAVQSDYPGPLGQLPTPAGLQILLDPTTGLPAVDVTAPLDVSTGAWVQPEQQTWSAVLQSLLGQTGTELFTDEDGSLVFRPPQYLNLPASPVVIEKTDIIGADLAASDGGVYTQIRVKWAYDAQYSQDGVYPDYTQPDQQGAYLGLRNQMRPRIHTVQLPWIRTQALAQYMAQVLFSMSVAGVLVGTLTIPVNPAIRIGHIIACPTLASDRIKDNALGYYYVNAITYNLEWNRLWTQTLSLAYGRSPDQSFPYLARQNYPRLSRQALAGQPAPNATGGLDRSVTNPSEFAAHFTVVPDGSVDSLTVHADPNGPLAPGMVVRIVNLAGYVLGQTPNGEYTVVPGAVGDSTTIGMAGITAPVQARVIVIAIAATAPPANGTTSNPTALASLQTVTGDGSDLPTPTAFTRLPVDTPAPVTQGFGPTSFTAEPSLYGYAHFHTGIDLGRPNGSLIYAPAGGVVRGIGWNLTVDGIGYTGFGYNTICRAGNLTFHFGHQVDGSAQVVVGDQVQAGTILGQVDSTGNSTGSHLHFGVYDHSQGSWVDPEPYFLRGGVAL